MSPHEKTGLTRRDVAKASGLALSAGATAAPAIVLAQANAAPTAPVSAPASASIAAAAVERVRDPILRISREVWNNAELSLGEEKSSAIHRRELEAAGFKTVSTGTSGTPTAFISEWTQGVNGPKLGFMPEYDALPGLGNAAEPRQTPGPAGTAIGHGCGHNLLGAGCTGAAIALKLMMEQNRISGTIRVYGCAAEEAQGVKVYMARDGLFNDLDACLAWHPAPIAGTGTVSTAASNAMKIRFHGRTAHAGVAPWEGRSALKAAEIFAHGVNLMREHILPTARIHYIYEAAGVAPNVVPDFSQIWMTIRDAKREAVVANTDWARQIAEGAALATQTRAEFQVYYGMYELMPNDPLIALVHRHMVATPLGWSADEQIFAKACQREMKLPEKGLAERVLPIIGSITTGGSTDVADVSYNTPVGIFGWPTMPLGTALHTWAVTACGGMSIGEKGAIAAARILAGVGYDVMTDSGLRQAARADLEKRRDGKPFVSPLPADQKKPIGIPAHLLKTGEDDALSVLRTSG